VRWFFGLFVPTGLEKIDLKHLAHTTEGQNLVHLAHEENMPDVVMFLLLLCRKRLFIRAREKMYNVKSSSKVIF
jgi:hypothetical protein